MSRAAIWGQALLSLGFFALVAFQTYILNQAATNLANVRGAQEQAVQDGLKLQAQVENLAGRVALLAQGGNANAKAVVEVMGRQGVTLAPPKAN